MVGVCTVLLRSGFTYFSWKTIAIDMKASVMSRLAVS